MELESISKTICSVREEGDNLIVGSVKSNVRKILQPLYHMAVDDDGIDWPLGVRGWPCWTC